MYDIHYDKMPESDIWVYINSPDGVSFYKLSKYFHFLETFLKEHEIDSNLKRDNEGFYKDKYGEQFKLFKGKEMDIIAKEKIIKFKLEEKNDD